MIQPVIGLLLALAGAPLGITLGEAPGVDAETRALLERAVAEAAESVTHAPVEAAAEPHLAIDGLGAATRLRIRVRWAAPPAEPGPAETVDLPRAHPEVWVALLGPVLRAVIPASVLEPPPLLPRPASPPPPPQLQAPPIEVSGTDAGPHWAPWISVSATALALGGGIGLGLLNRDLVTQGEASGDPAEVDRLNGQVFATGLGANVLLGGALVGAIVSTVLFLSEDP